MHARTQNTNTNAGVILPVTLGPIVDHFEQTEPPKIVPVNKVVEALKNN